MGANDEPTSLDRLRTQIFDTHTLYAQSYDEEFKPSYRVETFSKPDVIKGTCLGVIIRNMQLRRGDIQLFESSPDEYAEQVLGGSDLDTGHRAASDFLKALCKFFKSEVVAIFSECINSLLKSYFENPRSTWMHLNATISLVIVLGARGQTSKFGVTRVSEFLKSDTLVTPSFDV
uniref:Cse1 domain-containing protein n=1 Tax=Trichuris muris TaxID=70415 RepID=A0A5S6QIA2_TRIMR